MDGEKQFLEEKDLPRDVVIPLEMPPVEEESPVVSYISQPRDNEYEVHQVDSEGSHFLSEESDKVEDEDRPVV